MAPHIWLKSDDIKPCQFTVKDGKLNLKHICTVFQLDVSKPLRLGDWWPEVTADGWAEYDEDCAVGKTKNTASPIEGTSTRPAPIPIVKFSIKRTGGKPFEFSMRAPVEWPAFEQRFRTESGWEVGLFKLSAETGLEVTEDMWATHLRLESDGKAVAEVKLVAEKLDKGFSSFSRTDGLSYLELPKNYTVRKEPNVFQREAFGNLADLVNQRLKGFEKWTLKELVTHFVKDIQLRMLVFSSFTMQGLELTRRELISPVLILASLLAKSQVELRAEATVQGSLGCGPIDYTALIEQVQILLTEAKKAELKKAEGQLYAEMAAFREALARVIDPGTKKRKFAELDEILEGISTTGVRTDAQTWVLSRYVNKTLVESEEMNIDLKSPSDKTLQDQLMVVVGALTGAMNTHITEYETTIKTKRQRNEDKGTSTGNSLGTEA